MPGTTVRRSTTAAVAFMLSATCLTAQQSVKLPARDRSLTDRPTNVFTVGAEEGESWELFSGVRGAAFDAADHLYVLDGQNTRVLVFDARGRFVRQFGRRGGGPGELQAPLHIAVTADGSVVVNDIGNRAFVVFNTAGEHVKNVPYGMEEMAFPMALAADGRGGVLTRVTPRITGSGEANASRIMRHQLDGAAEARQVASFPVAPPAVVETSGSGTQRAFRVNADPVFAARPSFGALPDGGIALHTDAEYAVRIFDAAGRHVRTLSRDYPLRKVTKKDQETYQARQREATSAVGSANRIVVMAGPGGTTTGAPPVAAQNITVPTTFAEHMSVVTSVRTDPLGRLWVQRRQADGSERGPIDLVDASGRYIGTLPPQQAPSAVSASGLAAYVITDDLGVEKVTVRRLPANWR